MNFSTFSLRTLLLLGDGEAAEGNLIQTEGYKTYGAQELDAMGLPAMLLEEAPNPATLAGESVWWKQGYLCSCNNTSRIMCKKGKDFAEFSFRFGKQSYFQGATVNCS